MSPLYRALNTNPSFESNVPQAVFDSIVTGSIYILAGSGMLLRKKWGRILFLGYLPLGFITDYVFRNYTETSSFVIGGLSWALLVYFLTRHPVSAFFDTIEAEAGDEELENEASLSKGEYLKRMISILCLILSGLFILTLAVLLYIEKFSMGQLALNGLCYGVPAILLSLLAVHLWGWRKWAVLLGYFFMYVGLLMIFIAGVWTDVAISPLFIDHTTTIDKIRLGSLFKQLSFFFFAVGMLLNRLQKKQDLNKMMERFM